MADRAPLEMAMEMHQIQYERANRLEAENQRLQARLRQVGASPAECGALAGSSWVHEANERIGAALAHVKRTHPSVYAEALEYVKGRSNAHYRQAGS